MLSLKEIKTGISIMAASFAVDASVMSNEAYSAEPINQETIIKNPLDANAEAAAEILNVQYGMERFSGALKSAEPPLYDGAVIWGEPKYDAAAFLLGGAAAGAIGALAGIMFCTSSDSWGRESKNEILKTRIGAVIGFLIPFGIGVYKATEINEIKFQTTVNVTASENCSHTELVRSAKSIVERGPYYGQVLQIPETNLPLAANNLGAPYMDGQKIIAHFYLDNNNNIVSWKAEAARRR